MARHQRNTATVVKKGGGFLGKLLCLLLGFILGIVGTIGGVGGLGYYVVTQVKIKDAFSTINGMTGADIQYTDFVTEEIGEGSTYDLIMEIVGVVEDIGNGNGSLESLNQISPLVGTNIQTLLTTVAEYGVEIEYDELMNKPFAQLGEYLGETLNGIEIAPLLNTFGVEATGLIALICYGEEGRDFVYETTANGDYVLDDKGMKIILPIGDSQFATVGSLIDGALLNDRLGNLSFKGLMSALSNDGVNADDPLIRTLAYGVLGEDYDLVNGEVVPRPMKYVYDDATMNFTAPDGSVFELVEGSSLTWFNGDDLYIVENNGEDNNIYPLELVRKVDGEEGPQFNVVYQLGSDTAPIMLADDEPATLTFIAYKSGVVQYRGGMFLSDIIGENANLMDAIAPIRLGDLLGMDGSFDKILLTLAYGNEGTDYEIGTDNQIVLIPGGKTPLTLGELTSGQLDFLDTITLGSILGLNGESEPILLALAYGTKDVDYKIVDNKIVPIDGGKAPLTIGDLMGGDLGFLDSMVLGDVLALNGESDPILLALAYGTKDVDYEIVDNKIVHIEGGKAPLTIGDLTSGNLDFLNTIQLGELLGLNGESDPILLALAYGTKDVDYEIVDNKIVHIEGGKAPLTIGDLTSGELDFLDSMVLGDVLALNGESDPILLALAYGTKDVDYEIVDNKIVHIEGGKAPLTIGDLTSGDMDFLNTMQLGEILGLNGESDPILLALAYGTKGTDYDIVDNKIVLIEGGKAPLTIGDLTSGELDFLDSMVLGDVLALNGESDPILLALAYGTKGTDYDIVDNKIVHIEGGKAPLTIGDLTSGEMDFLNTMQLGEILGLNGDSEPILLALAYGTEGKDYNIDPTTKEIVLIEGGKAPLTIGDLTSGELDFLDSMVLGDVLSLNGDSDPILLALAYGTEGTDYNIDPVTKEILPIEGGKAPLTIGDLTSGELDFLDSIELGTLLGIEFNADLDPSDIMTILAYGSEGTHYYFDENGNPQWYEGYGPRTVQDLIDDQDALLNDLYIADILGVDATSDSMMIALAYGVKDVNYTIDNNGTSDDNTDDRIVMLPKVYTLETVIEGGNTVINVIDQNDKVVGTATEENGVYTVNSIPAEGEEAQFLFFLKETDSSLYAYATQEDIDSNNKIFHKKVSLNDLMNGDTSDILNRIELASLFEITLTPQSDFNDFMVILAFGNKGTHFDVNDNGTPDNTDDDYIEWLDGNKPRTVQYLIENKDNLMDEIQLGSLLGIPFDKNLDPSDIMTILAYGNEGTHYYFDTNGDPQWNDGYGPRSIQYLIDNKETLFDEIALADILGVEADSDDILLALAYGNQGTHYKIEGTKIIMLPKIYTLETAIENENTVIYVIDADGNKVGTATLTDGVYTVTSIPADGEAAQFLFFLTETDSKLYAYATQEDIDSGNKIFHKKTTLSDLMGENPASLINRIELRAVLGIELTEENANDIMSLLAFGTEGTHYDFGADGKPEYKNGYRPRTIQYLIENQDDLMNEIELRALLDIELTEENASDIMSILAFGSEGTHYEFGADGKPEYKTNTETGEKYRPRTVQDLINEKDTLFDDIINELELGELFEIPFDATMNPSDIMTILAYGNEGTDYYFDANGDPQWYDGHEPRTVKYLIDNQETLFDDIINDYELGELFEIPFDATMNPNDIMTILAYGNEGTHYAFNEVTGEPEFKEDAVTGEKYEPRTVKYLIDHQSTLLEEIELGTLLGIKFDKDLDSSDIMTILAYGNEGTEYYFDTNGDPQWNDGYGPRSVQYLIDSQETLLEEIELGSLLGIKFDKTLDPNDVMTMIAYGNEGTEYYFDETTGEPKWNDGYGPRSVQYLIDNKDTLFNDVTLESVLGVDAHSEAIMRSLAYGNQGTHYKINNGDTADNTEDDFIEMLPKVYYVLANNDVADQSGKIIGKTTAPVDGVYGIALVDGNGDPTGETHYAKKDAEGTLYVYATPEEAALGNEANRLLHEKVTLNSLVEEDSTAIFERIELSTVLNIDIFAEGNDAPDSLMVSLVYGNENEHYTLDRVNKEINWLPDENGIPYHSRTIGDLKNGSDDLIDSLYLVDVLSLDPADPNASPMMLALALGNKGVHYKLEDGEAVMLERKVFLADPDSSGNVTVYDEEHLVVGTLGEQKYPGSGHTIYEITERRTGDTMYIRLADESSNTEDRHYHIYNRIEDALADVSANEDGKQTRLFHEKTKFTDLRGHGGADCIERIELSAALGIDLLDDEADDPMMVALVYGNEDEHYTATRDSSGKITSITWKKDPATGLPYHARTIHDLKDTNKLLDDIYLDTILGVDATCESEIMLMLSYGPDYKIEDGKIIGDRKRVSELKNAENLIDDIYLDTALGLNASSPAVLLSIAYGADYEIVDVNNTPDNLADDTVKPASPEDRTKIGDLKNTGAAENLITGVKMDKIIKTDGKSAIMNYIVYGSTTDRSNSRTLGDFMYHGDNIVSDMLNELVLADVLPEDLQNSKFLKHIDWETTKLNNLGDALDSLSVQDILTEDMYRFAWFNKNTLAFKQVDYNGTGDDPDTTLYERHKAVNDNGTWRAVEAYVLAWFDQENNFVSKATPADTTNLQRWVTIETFDPVENKNEYTLVTPVDSSINDKYVYYYYLDNQQATDLHPVYGVWKYLLVEDDNGTKREVYCNLTALGGVTSNMSSNMEAATLSDLEKDGLITFESSSAMMTSGVIDLNIPGYPCPVDPMQTPTLGDLTVNECLEYITYLLNAIAYLQNSMP